MTVPIFPSLIGMSYPVTRKPTWSTIKQKAVSGKEYRLQLQTYPLWSYEAAFDYLGSGGANTDFQTLSGFVNKVGGAALPFLFPDPYDGTATNASLGTGDGVTTTFNFVRPWGGFVEPVQAVQTITNVKVNGSLTSSYTLLTDPNFGLTYGLTLNTAPGSGQTITWTGTYDWACRFDDDTIEFSNFAYLFWEAKKLPFTTMKVL